MLSVGILLTFDVEDWFQVENLKQRIPFSAWPKCELRVEQNIHRILDLLDSIKLHHSLNSTNPMNSINPKATFFILGWIAKRLPDLVREIQARGHEVASHGYFHQLCREQLAEDLKRDLVRSKKLLEELTGNPVYGYRAPSFSVDDAALRIIEECGYLYDSSFNSFKLNRRYGQIGLPNNGNNGAYHQISDNFFELPISNLRIGNRVIPWGGGGYFRLIPLELFKRGVKSILKKHDVYLFYLHPWEIDPDQPKITEVHLSLKLRHYVNLGRTFGKLKYFIENFNECCFQTCHQYLKSRVT